jgi:hypothetical protein
VISQTSIEGVFAAQLTHGDPSYYCIRLLLDECIGDRSLMEAIFRNPAS